ncbi:MAG: glutathione S-transferase N-terminal domain-containing protein, partial [Gammaproteobacteria bacterium]|nr:glutathione S-transferase N-terminal domain-containing protein [Gammaproteobacteria bacterium]
MNAFTSMPSNQQLIFYYYPRACSLAVHIVLEESGLVYERRMVDLPTKQNSAIEYLAINPKGTVPALVVDGETLTETQAILTFLGDIIGDGKFLPPTGDFRRYRAHEWMNFLSSSVHAYIRSIFRAACEAGERQVAHAAVKV